MVALELRLVYNNIMEEPITKEKILELLDSGLSKKAIASHFGKKRETFSHYLRKYELTTPKNLFTEVEIDQIKEYYPNLPKDQFLGRFPNRTEAALMSKVRALELYKKIPHPMRTPKSNLSILLNESLESYYWLGYILADGNVSSNLNVLSLCSSTKDETQMRKYAVHIGTENLYYRAGPSGFSSKITKGVSVTTQDPTTIKLLIERFDLKPRKTFNPPSVGKYTGLDITKLISLFLGFIDGDGSVRFEPHRREYALYAYGTEDWAPFFDFFSKTVREFFPPCNPKVLTRPPRDFLDKNGVLKVRRPGAMFRVLSKELLVKLKRFAEENHLPVLSRKWDKIKYEDGNV